MSVPVAIPSPGVRPLIESRPPAISWAPRPIETVSPDQPALDLQPNAVDLALRREPGIRMTTVRARWTVRPRPSLPNASVWSASLVVALVRALLAQRPIAQLNRWLADDVLAAVSRQQRQHRSTPARRLVPVSLHSVRVQHPHPDAAEVAARVAVGTTSLAAALRLEALGDRWLCTALEIDPRLLR